VTRETYLKNLFGRYYEYAVSEDWIAPVPELPHREFAMVPFEGGSMIRHVGYATEELLHQNLVHRPPRHLYYSAARYKTPSAQKMALKGPLGCDFIVDIDADHFDLPCIGKHNFSYCTCGWSTKGTHQGACPECRAPRTQKVVWVCDECLEVTKLEIVKLVDNFLVPDFGFTPNELEIAFSGHRGYHLHISDERVLSLSSDMRRQMADYFSGAGISFERLGAKAVGSAGIWGGEFKKTRGGWAGRIARHLLWLTEQSPTFIVGALQARGCQPRYAKKFAECTEHIRHLINDPQINNWKIPGLNMTGWTEIWNATVKMCAVDIDVPVTIDTRRLIRLIGSLHGKSGLVVRRVPYNELGRFDPLTEAVPFKGTTNKIKIVVTAPETPPTTIGGHSEPEHVAGDQINAPIHLALYYLCKEVADLAPTE
jgi:DNA primase small subunit